jgi:hypothetical protein
MDSGIIGHKIDLAGARNANTGAHETLIRGWNPA